MTHAAQTRNTTRTVQLPPHIWQLLTQWLRRYRAVAPNGPPGTIAQTQLQALTDQAQRLGRKDRPLSLTMPADSWDKLIHQLDLWESNPAMLQATCPSQEPPREAISALHQLLELHEFLLGC